MRSLWGRGHPASHVTNALTSRGDRERKCHVTTGTVIKQLQLQAKERRILLVMQEQLGEAGENRPEPSEGAWPCQHCNLGLWPLELQDNDFTLF